MDGIGRSLPGRALVPGSHGSDAVSIARPLWLLPAATQRLAVARQHMAVVLVRRESTVRRRGLTTVDARLPSYP